MRVRIILDSLKERLTLICIIMVAWSAIVVANELDNKPIGGSLSTTDLTEICQGDNIYDAINLQLEGNVGDSSLFVLTSSDGVIREMSTEPYFDLTGLGDSSYKLLHISYDEFTVPPRVGINIKKIKGWFDTSNEIVVNLFSAFGGYIRSVDNNAAQICVSDGVADILELEVSSQRGDRFGWVVTNEQGEIQQLVNSSRFNFEGTAAGIVNIHHYASFGDVSPRIGQNINNFQSCIDFSRPYTVEKLTDCSDLCTIDVPQIGLGGDTDRINVCLSDDLEDRISIEYDGDLSSSALVVVDGGQNILQVEFESLDIVLEQTNLDECILRLVSFDRDNFSLTTETNLNDLRGCYKISNPIFITKLDDCAVDPCQLRSGFISINGSFIANVCVDDGEDDRLVINKRASTDYDRWLVLDSDGLIIEIQQENEFDFEGDQAGAVFITLISLETPSYPFVVGQHVDSIEVCHALSNQLTIYKLVNCAPQECSVQGGLISANAQTSFTLCVDDGVSDLIEPGVSGNVGDSQWVITDTMGVIMMVSADNMFNFEGVGEGVCLIWHVSTDGEIIGLEEGENFADVEGCIAYSNPITIIREINCGFVCDVEGGMITLEDGSDSVTICKDDDVTDSISVILTDNVGSSSWIVTDTNGTILDIRNSPIFSLDQLAVGECQIWHISLKDPITGFGVGRNLSDIEGCTDLSNAITVIKEEDCAFVCDVDGGSISFGGITEFTQCVDDGIPDNVVPTVSGNSGQSIWVVINEQGDIQLIQESADFQFEGSGAGLSFIYHIAFEGSLVGLNIGSNLQDIMGCYELSNRIVINRLANCGNDCEVDGGAISIGGITNFTICVDDGIDNDLTVSLSGNVGSSIYLLTNDQRDIVAIQESPTFSFEGTGEGTQFIIHLSFEDPIQNLETGMNVSDIEGCTSLSNEVIINRQINCGVCDVQAGSISLNGTNTTTICTDDQEEDILEPSIVGATDSNLWFATDEDGEILIIQQSNRFNFTNISTGRCFIYNISFEGDLDQFEVGSNVSEIDGCFDLSNSIEVIRLEDCGVVCEVEGGRISTNGQTSVTVCVSDDLTDMVSVQLEGNSGSSTWLVTDESGEILLIQNSPDFDFTTVPVGRCFIRHMSLQDPITGFGVGLQIDEIEGCFDFSNPIEVIRLEDCGVDCDVEGGLISTNGQTSVTICISDDLTDIITVQLDSNSGSSTWFVTDESGEILLIQNDTDFNFTTVPAGRCFIWHMSFKDPIAGFSVGLQVEDLEGCLDLSNSIEVIRLEDCGDVCNVEGGNITTADGGSSVSVCVDDGQAESIEIIVMNNTGPSTWVITDDTGEILKIQNSNIFSFEGVEGGNCRIYHMSLDDTVEGFAIGADIADLGGCFDLSNSIAVERQTGCGAGPCEDIEGGNITTADGGSSVSVCVDDGQAESIEIIVMNNTGPSTWVITDDTGEILKIQNSNIFSFEGVEGGNCRIYHMSLDDTVEGFAIGADIADLGGCFDLSNSIAVERQTGCGAGPCEDIEGGNITTADGGSSVSVCVDDGQAESIEIIVMNNTGPSTWVITDDTGEILKIQNSNIFSFEGVEGGNCRIYHMSLDDTVEGFAIGANIADLGGCFDLSNSIAVERQTGCGAGPCEDIEGGNITTSDGGSSVSVCVDDGQAESIEIILTNNTGPSTWVITDDTGEILKIQNSNLFSFEGVEGGNCRIYHMSLDDTVEGFAIGANIADLGGCFDLSNSIAVERQTGCGAGPCEDIEGGNITTADGGSSVSVCVDDGQAESIEIVVMNNTGPSTWVITDDTGEILKIQNSNLFSFEGVEGGNCRIYHMSLDDTVEGFAIGANIADLGGCFDLSNSIAVERQTGCGAGPCEDIEGGNITTADGGSSVSVCVDDGQAESIEIILTNNTGPSTWVITDDTGEILKIQNSNLFSFEGVEGGNCRIYHMSLDDTVEGFAIGANIADLGGCFDLSNSIAVERQTGCGAGPCEDIEGGNITTADGGSSVSVCVDDGQAESIEIILMNNTGPSTWVITDDTGEILKIQNSNLFSFEGVEGGNCRIYHMSLDDTVEGFAIGANIADLGGCFDLSNSIAVERQTGCGAGPCEDIEGGNITTADGGSSVSVCVDDGQAESIEIILMNNTGPSTWLITDDTGEILKIQNTNLFSFEGVEGGNCRIYHMSLDDTVEGFAIGANIADLGGCFDLSNSIAVERQTGCGAGPCEDIEGGNITTADGGSSVSVCVDDGQAESIEIILTNNTGPSTWVITDDTGEILKIQNSNLFSFEGVEGGNCRIYHMSLDDTVEGFAIGANIADLGGCFDLSNSIAVERQTGCGPDPCVIDAGMIVLSNNETAIVYCTDDEQSDVLNITLTDNIGPSIWLLTDAQGTIEDIQSSPNFNFEGSEEGGCFVYHMSLIDPVSGFVTGNNISDIEGCFELSNAVSIQKVTGCGPNTCMVDGGVIQSSDSLTVKTVCVTDGLNDDISIVAEGVSGARLWVVTDVSGIIVTVQAENTFNFEGGSQGTCFIYSIALKDPLTGFDIGSPLADLNGCYDLSNPVTINKLENCDPDPIPMGGNANLVDNSTEMTICVDDGLSDRITASVTSNEGESSWIVTDADGQIITVQAVPTFEFEGAGEGVCLIRHVASFGTLMGLQAGQNISDVSGNFALSNSITITKQINCGEPECMVEGGVLSTDDNLTFINLCITDDEPDTVNVLVSNQVGDSSIFVITDSGRNIIDISSEASIDFTNVSVGRCFIWHISYTDDLENVAVDQNLNNITGCFDLSNSVEVSRIDGCEPIECEDIRSGSISSMNGSTTVTVCIDDGMQENLIVDLMDNVGGSLWVITDANDLIIDAQNDNMFNFEGEQSGMCFIRHIAALGEVTGLLMGNHIDSIMGCFEISNRLGVNKELCSDEPCTVEGGMIMTTDSLTSITLCVTDNMSDMFGVTLTGNSGISQWMITDSTGMVIGIQEGEDRSFDFESSGIGMCQVRHIATRDSSFILNLGMDIDQLEGCFSLSNPITVTRLGGECANPECDDILAGSIQLLNGELDTILCVDDGINENLQVQLTGNTGAGFFVITDTTGLILDLENQPLFNFEGTTPGVSYINYVSLLEPFGGLVPGLNIDDATGCIKRTNVIRVERVNCMEPLCEVTAGTIAFVGDTDGELDICVDDNIADEVGFSVNGNVGIGTWLVTNSTGSVIQVSDSPTIDFEGYDEGRCLIMHAVVRDSTFVIRDGDNTNDLEGCIDFSNSLIINKSVDCAMDSCVVDGGTITTANGDTSISICATDGVSDAFDVVVMDNVGPSSIYIVTDSSGIILGAQFEATVDLEGAGEGMCSVYHASYQDSLPGIGVGTMHIDELTGCVAISNSITVFRDGGSFDGGTIEAQDGGSQLTVCTDDGMVDSLQMALSSSRGSLAVWIFTDVDDNIVGLFEGVPPIPLADSIEATAIRHMTYSPNLAGLRTATNIDQFEGCFDLSNSLSIVRQTNCTDSCTVTASTIAFDANGGSLTVCVDDGDDDMVNVTEMSTGDFLSQWVITDTTGIVLSLPTEPPFNFEGQDSGACDIRLFSYIDSIDLEIGSPLNVAELSGCFAESNTLRVIKEVECAMDTCQASASVISFAGGASEMAVCIDDGLVDSVMVSLTAGMGDTSIWLVTDTTGLIIALPDGPPFNFEGVDPGVCLLWNLTTVGQTMGIAVDSSANDITGCFAFSNSLRVIREIECGDNCLADAGTVSSNGGETTIDVCSGDGFEDIVALNVDTEIIGSGGVWLLTDTLGQINRIIGNESIDFEGTAAGTSLIYHLSFVDTIGNVIVSGNIDNLIGCFDLSNPIEVRVEEDCLDCPAVGGMIVLADGTDTTMVCSGDGDSDFLGITLTGEVGESSFWVVTDTMGIITDVEDDSNINFDGSEPDDRLVRHISVFGTVTNLVIGLNISELEGCFDLSNPITIMRSFVDGAEIFLDSMQAEVTFCVGDGEQDIIRLTNNSTSEFNYTYLITDVNNRLLSINGSGTFDVDNISVGRCRLYGVSHPGEPNDVFTITSQENVTEVPIAPCFELSENFIQLNRVSGEDCPENGAVEDPGVQFVTMGNPIADQLNLRIYSENVEGMLFIELRDISGQLMLSESLDIGIGQTDKALDVSQLKSGYYIATMRHPSVVLNKKIIIQH